MISILLFQTSMNVSQTGVDAVRMRSVSTHQEGSIVIVTSVTLGTVSSASVSIWTIFPKSRHVFIITLSDSYIYIGCNMYVNDHKLNYYTSHFYHSYYPLNWIKFYYQSTQVQIWKSINRYIKFTEIIEHIGSQAITGILVQKYILKIMNNKNNKNKIKSN